MKVQLDKVLRFRLEVIYDDQGGLKDKLSTM